LLEFPLPPEREYTVGAKLRVRVGRVQELE